MIESILGLFIELYRLIFKLKDPLAKRESAPWSVLSKIFKNNLSIISNKVLIDFLKPSLRKFIDLTDADFSGSDLQGASFFDAKLENADLSNTNMKDVTMDAAILNGANLSNSILESAFAYNAKFEKVIINGADFTDVLIANDVRKKLCIIADGVNNVTNKKTIETLDC